ncbi:hypothetical protein BDN70DRAFT_603567 [Pholiota conissans]|uniref:Uncharacterized protein n=1 Tax=Pholiota conissans TaxID=109636 RepID=A0A9P5Z373_9AGAR|nr:hypothetical protein BDN70DRAFT_603567 [Pholiota conissans]
MRHSLALVFSRLLLMAFAHSGSLEPKITADGVPAGFIQPAMPPGNRTDFDAIYADVSKSATLSSRSAKGVRIAARQARTKPKYFERTFGPINAASNAGGYIGFVTFPSYDVNACAASCNAHGFNTTGGPCVFFNIWTAVINGASGNTVCSLYNSVAANSTSTYTGQGDLIVTASRGYKRKSLIKDGSFQDYTCVVTKTNGCPYAPSRYWTRFVPAGYDFVLINNGPAHTGNSSTFFYFSPPSPDAYAYGATLEYALPTNAVEGKTYVISFFYTNSNYSPAPTNLTGPLVSALWNGVSVIGAPQVGPETFDGLSYMNIFGEVVAQGGDTFALQNGIAFAHAMYVDDISIFEKWY